MPVPGQETAKSPSELKEIQTPQLPSHLDAKTESDKAQAGLDSSLKKGGKKSGSRLTDFRDRTDRTEEQVSIMNKDVHRDARLEGSTDV